MRLRGLLAALGIVIACVSVACAPDRGVSQRSATDLEVVSWWTSGSEKQGLTVLFDAYRAAHPGATVINGAVAGGGGSNAQVVLAQRLLSGNPPDVWQTFPGGALRAYVDQGQVADLSDLYGRGGLAAVLPEVIRDGLTVEGKQYGVPTSAHRGNMLFYNTALLAKAGVTQPGAGYLPPTFLDDLAKLDKAGITPLCLGAKDPFTTTALFENTLLSVVGADGWRRIAEDRFHWDSDSVAEALRRFGQILDYADPQAAALTWDAATKKLAAGECAFETLNDSAFGELVSAGAVDGKTFGEVPYPGTDGTYVAVVDTFVRARQSENARKASEFLAVLGSPETQLAFSKAKGSVPIRTDVDVSSLTPYQQSAAKALRSDTVLWSIVHGEAMRPQFQQGFYDAVATYVRSRDAKAFRTTLTDAMRRQAPPK
ncbi:MAG: glucose/mannose transport system substrate-binding protein [Pseudonocardiales bacterium]|jgi:glucose/mannose transport system substrate-binding protein|nr:glucose/mannose transport system substrate-binding protein [Pseudonocardiales bacterium]